MREIPKKEYDKYSEESKSQHPDQIMVWLVKLIEEIGANKFLKGAGLNKERDSFIAVLFAYAIRKWSHREWFLQQLKNDPPDFNMISPTDDTTRKKPIDHLSVEIVELRDETLEGALGTLERTKLTNYKPEKGMILLIYINSTIGLVKLKELNSWVVRNKEKFANFGEVYMLLFHSFSSEKAITYSVVNLYKLWSQTCSLIEEFNKGILFPHPLIEKHTVKLTD